MSDFGIDQLPISLILLALLAAILVHLARINRNLVYLMQDRSRWHTLRDIQYHVRMDGQVDAVTPQGSYVFANLDRFNRFLKRFPHLS